MHVFHLYGSKNGNNSCQKSRTHAKYAENMFVVVGKVILTKKKVEQRFYN